MLAAQMRAGATVPTPPISGAIDFFASVVERCHEAKEEALFPLLAGYGGPEDGSLRALRTEHEEGRRLIGELGLLSGRRRVEGQALTLLQAYIALLRGHMAGENTRLF